MSQNAQILAYLEAGHWLTPMGALRRFGCFRLGARIYELRKDHLIKTERVRNHGKNYARYSIGEAS